jgi:hypothetical protein
MTESRSIENLSPAELRKTWKQLTPADWLSMLQEIRPDNDWTLSGSEIKGRCIYHNETTPSLKINLDKGYVHCFGASCQKHIWNPIRFVGDVFRGGYAQATKELKTRFGISFPATYTRNLQKIEDNEALKQVLQRVMNVELVNVLTNESAPEYEYARAAGVVEWLRKRELPEDAIHRWPVGILPTRERLSQLLSSESVSSPEHREMAFEYLKEYVALPGNTPIAEGSLVFFYYTSPTTVGRFRIRMPNSDKYYAIEDPYQSDIGFFGLNMFPELRGKFGEFPIYVVEGEFDALSLIAHQLSTGNNDMVVVAVGGTMETDISPLAEFGFSSARLIPDNDVGGVGWARTLMEENNNVSGVYRWRADGVPVKDVDEAVRAYGFNNIYAEMSSEKAYAFNHEWCLEQVGRKLESIPAGDVQTRSDVVSEFGKALRDAEREAFIETVIQDFGISKSAIVRDMASDDPDSFREQIKQRLRKTYHFLTESRSGKTESLMVWSNPKKVIRTVYTDSTNHIKSVLQKDLGQFEKFVREEIGEPDFIKYKPGPRGKMVEKSSRERVLDIAHHVAEALIEVSEEVPPKEKLELVGQGVHLFVDAETEGYEIYVVNGEKLFRGVIDGMKVRYEELDSPVHKNYLFQLNTRRWSENLNTIEDLEAGQQYTPKEVYTRIKHLLNVGWKFQDNELESMFLAADAMYTSIFSVFKNITMVKVNGWTHTGKSSLLHFIGGSMFGEYRLCEATCLIDDFSVAGIMQFIQNNRFRILLDEFEEFDYNNPGIPTKKTRAVQEFAELLRSMTSGELTKVRGTSSGDVQVVHAKFPVTLCNIYSTDQARDLSRYIQVNMKKIEGAPTPISAVQHVCSPKQIVELRRKITLCLLPRIAEVLKSHAEVEKEFDGGRGLPPGMLSRQASSIFPAAAILKLAGEDYKTFVYKMCELKLQQLTALGGTKSEAQIIWDDILQTPISLRQFSDNEGGGIASLSKIILNSNLLYLLNSASDLGAYYLEDKHWLIVFWQKAMQTILRGSNKYRTTTYHGRIKSTADMDPRVIPRDKLMRGSFLKSEVWPRIGTRVSLDDISVIDLSDTLVDVRLSQEEPIVRDAHARSVMMNDTAQNVVGVIPSRKGDFDA